METQTVIEKLEALYQTLMSKNLTPDEEAQAKVQLLELLSSVRAHAEIQGGEQARVVLEQTNSLKDLLLEWDPYGSAWFKEEKTLVNSVYNLLAVVKTLTIQKTMAADNMSTASLTKKIDDIAASLQGEIMNLQVEVEKIRKSMIALATAVKEKLSAPPAPQQVVKSNSTPVEQEPVPLMVKPTPVAVRPTPVAVKPIAAQRVPVPKPVPLPEELPPERTGKPISLPKPVPVPIEEKAPESRPQPFHTPVPRPISIPKSEPRGISRPKPKPIPLDEAPAPISLSEPPSEDEEPPILDDLPEENRSKSQLFGTLSKNAPQKKPNKEQLFNLFSSGSSGSSESKDLEIIEDPSQPRSSSADQPAQIFPHGTQTKSEATPETLYQELISLEGKRYSIERSIRDLKTDREKGVLSDQEYKEKLSQLLNKLQGISKRIGEIREKLD